jgi:hypothetical protein
MKLRSLLAAGPALAAAALAACSEQRAGAFVGVNEFNTGVARAIVRSDTASSTTTPKLVAPSNVRVALFRVGDTVAIRTVTTTNGVATFVGLDTGQYILRPLARAGSSFAGQSEDTVTVTAGDTASTDTLRVRLGARITGFVASQYFAPDPDTARQVTNRFPGVEIRFYRETAPNVWDPTPFARDTTDATGTFDIPVSPGPLRVRLEFNSDTAPLAKLKGGSADSLLYKGAGNVPATRGIVADTLPSTGSGSLNPNADVTRNQLFTFKSAIRVVAFRDLNNNGTREANENLVSGDTVRVRLAIPVVTGTDTTFKAISGTANVTSTVTTGTPPGTTVFSSLKGGTYVIVYDPSASRFPSDPNAFRRGSHAVVVVPNSATIVSVAVPVPFGP